MAAQEIATSRMLLRAASEAMLKALLEDAASLASMLGVRLAPGWPPLDNRGFMRSMLEAIQRDPTVLGWGPWFMLLEREAMLVGDAGFIAKPDARGVVEVGYGVAEPYRKRGLATEAVRALIDWAFAHGARTVVAECAVENVASVRVLQKAGMHDAGRNGRMLNWRREKD